MPPAEAIAVVSQQQREGDSSLALKLFFSSVIALALFGLAWRAQHFVLIVIAGVLAVCVVFSLAVKARDALARRKFGDVILKLDAMPTVGGRLRALLSLPPSTAGAGTLYARLECEMAAAPGRGHMPHWGDVRHFVPDATGLAILGFDIPGDLPSSGETCRWELKLWVEMKGLDLVLMFPLIVGPAVPTQSAKDAPTDPLPEPEPEPDNLREPAGAGATAVTPNWRSTLVLVAVNLLPIAGIILWDWRLSDLVFLYWMENLVIGLFALLRLGAAQPRNPDAYAPRGLPAAPDEALLLKSLLALFLVLFYGGFCLMHGMILAHYFPGGDQSGLYGSIRAALQEKLLVLTVLAMATSHAYSWWFNYLARGEFRGVRLGSLMIQPFNRIAVTHAFIIAVAFLVQAMNSPVAALLSFVAIKIALDAWFHRREHRS